MLSNKELNARIAGIRRSSAAIRENVHEVLVNAAGHAYQHGDVTAFTRLFDAASGLNRKAIARWVNNHGFAVLQKDGSFKLNKSAKDKADFASGDDVVAYLTENVNPWYVAEENAEQIVKDLDPAKRILTLAKQIRDADPTKVRLRLNVVDIKAAFKELSGVIGNELEERRNMVTVE